MKQDWEKLTELTRDKPLTIERVALDGEDIAVEGRFELPPLARLTADDQVFVAVFVKVHGSIKQMEKHFGISYPTVKSRLNRIGRRLGFVDVEAGLPRNEIIDRLEAGELTVKAAIEALSEEEDRD